MLNKLQEKLKAAAEAAKDLPEMIKVPEEVQAERFSKCEGCEKLYRPTYTCKVCGCFMKVKTWMPSQACPIGKWGRHKPNNTETNSK
jgi:rubrerythrin